MKFLVILSTFFCAYCSAESTSFRVLTDVQIWSVASSPPKIAFQTSVEFHQTKCQYLRKGAHLVVSVNSSVESPPVTYSKNDHEYDWVLLVSDNNLSARQIKNIFQDAAKHGYLAVILATEKHSKNIFSNSDWESLLDGEFIDGYLVNPWDFKILSTFAYPIKSDYSSVIFHPRKVLYSNARTRQHDYICNEEYQKPFDKRQYNSDKNQGIIWIILHTLDIIVDALVQAYHFNLARTLLQWFLLGVSYKVVQDSRNKMSENKKLKLEMTTLQKNPPKCIGCSRKGRIASKLESLHFTMWAFLYNQFSCDICKELLMHGMETVCCKQSVCADCYYYKCDKENGSKCPLCRAEWIRNPTLLSSLNEEIDDILERLGQEKREPGISCRLFSRLPCSRTFLNQ